MRPTAEFLTISMFYLLALKAKATYHRMTRRGISLVNQGFEVKLMVTRRWG
jgi:hypothetical protein